MKKQNKILKEIKEGISKSKIEKLKILFGRGKNKNNKETK